MSRSTHAKQSGGAPPGAPGRPRSRGTLADDRSRRPRRSPPAVHRPARPVPGGRHRPRLVVAVSGALAAVAVAVLVVAGAPARGPSGPGAVAGGPPGPEGVPLEEGPLLAPSATPAGGAPVDGIGCGASEQVAYHVHTHLGVYVDGRLRPLPAGVGIVDPVPRPTAEGPFDEASRCYYWLHVHAQDGVIHIESPSVRTYTLGQFFDLWGQPLGPGRVGPASGPTTVYVDGRHYRGDPRRIPLGSHETIQIDVGAPTVAPRGVDWSGTGL